ncbi:MAG: hypothetical protein LC778_08895 [Acidobacteria bacterium]|nr:hypothetical protein [Acidobacteriota bacterium]
MKSKMNILMNAVLFCLLCSFALPTFAQSPSLEGQQTGKVQFSVIMPNDVLIPFLSIVIEGENYQKKLDLSAEDYYEKANLVELPVGIYQVSSRNGNYYAFQRAPFRVRGGAVTKINVFPLIRVQVQMLMADGSDKYEFAPKPKYDSFPVTNSPHSELIMLIRYDEKRRRRNFVEYSSKVYEFRGSPEPVTRGVMVSYDALAVHADKIRFDNRSFVLEAQGNIVIEDGNQRIKANNAVIKFKGGVPEITRN